MGNFHSKPDRRSGFRKDRGSGGSFGGESRGFGGRPRSRGARRFGSENREMHEATCDKCGKQCSIPFRPSGGKPVSEVMAETREEMNQDKALLQDLKGLFKQMESLRNNSNS